MEYRSDIRIMTSKRGYEELEKYVEKFLKEHGRDSDWNLLKSTDYFEESPYLTYFGWNGLKWYENSDYIDVDAIMKGLDYLEENNYSYRYSRLGEDYDDYDEHYYDSEEKDEKNLLFPSIIREFDDDYIMQELKIESEISNNEIEV